METEEKGDLDCVNLKLPESKKSKVSFNDDKNSIHYITDTTGSSTYTSDTQSEQSDKIDLNVRAARVSSAMDNLREYKAPPTLTKSSEALRRNYQSKQRFNTPARRLFYTDSKKKQRNYDLWDCVPSTRNSDVTESEPSYTFTEEETECSSLLDYGCYEPGVSKGYNHDDFKAPEALSFVDMVMQMSLAVIFVYVVFNRKKS